jgi:DNA-binding phage protein
VGVDHLPIAVDPAEDFGHADAHLDRDKRHRDRDVARAKGMTELAHATGLGRVNLYKALSPDGNPEFAAVARVLKALGLRLSVAA